MEHRSNAILGQSTCPNHACCKDQEIDEAIAKAQAGKGANDVATIGVFGSNSGYFHNCQ